MSIHRLTRWCPRCRAHVIDEECPHWDYKSDHDDDEPGVGECGVIEDDAHIDNEPGRRIGQGDDVDSE